MTYQKFTNSFYVSQYPEATTRTASRLEKLWGLISFLMTTKQEEKEVGTDQITNPSYQQADHAVYSIHNIQYNTIQNLFI